MDFKNNKKIFPYGKIFKEMYKESKSKLYTSSESLFIRVANYSSYSIVMFHEIKKKKGFK